MRVLMTSAFPRSFGSHRIFSGYLTLEVPARCSASLDARKWFTRSHTVDCSRRHCTVRTPAICTWCAFLLGLPRRAPFGIIVYFTIGFHARSRRSLSGSLSAPLKPLSVPHLRAASTSIGFGERSSGCCVESKRLKTLVYPPMHATRSNHTRLTSRSRQPGMDGISNGNSHRRRPCGRRPAAHLGGRRYAARGRCALRIRAPFRACWALPGSGLRRLLGRLRGAPRSRTFRFECPCENQLAGVHAASSIRALDMNDCPPYPSPSTE